MRVMISGSSGLLATALIEEMLGCAYIEEIHALSSCPDKVQSLHGSNSNLRVIEFGEAVRVLASGECDLLIHAAFPRRNDPQSIAEGLGYTETLLGHLPSSCALVHISSQSVYDSQRTTPAKEGAGLENPTSPYAAAKYAAEGLVAGLDPEIKRSNIRLASLLSPRLEDRFVNKLVRQGLETGELKIYGPNNRFGFLDVEDAASAIATMARTVHTKGWHDVYNVGPHRMGYSLDEIAGAVKNALSKRGKPCRIESSLEALATSSDLDSALFERDFSWRSRKSLGETIDEIIDFQLMA